MAKPRKRKRGGGGGGKRRVLKDHAQKGKKFTPPLLQFPMTPWVWTKDVLPDMLWLAAMLEEHDPGKIHTFLDHVNDFVEGDPSPVVDGRLTTFDHVRDASREKVVARLRGAGLLDATPGRLVQALSLYPECPGLWLFRAALLESDSDPDGDVRYLKRLVADHYDSRSQATAVLRLMTLARLAKAGRLRVTQDSEMPELFSRYPDGLGEDDKNKAEAMIRARFGSAVAAETVRQVNDNTSIEEVEAARDQWAAHFWRHGMQISVCEFGDPSPASEARKSETTGNQAPDQASEVEASEEEEEEEEEEALSFEDYLSGLERATVQLGDDLRAAQERAAQRLDPYERVRDEVLLGLASRQFRLFNYLVADPYLWTSGRAPYFLRALVDGLIVTKWLLSNDELEQYERSRSFGLGKLKLLKEHLASRVEGREDALADDQREYLKAIERELNAEQWEALTEVDVGATFSGRSVFEMAREVGLDDEYDLAYQPFSSEAHGEWTSLKDADLIRCTNPLHGYHQVGRFERTKERLRPEIVEAGVGFVEASVGPVFDRYGVSVEEAFETWRS